MSNQEGKFTTIDISYPCVGGDKLQQGLQEYADRLQFNKDSFLEAVDSLASKDFEQVVDIMYYSDAGTLRPGAIVINIDEL